MPDSILYLLKANLAIILFYLGYRLLLRKLTFYTLNRFYLLFALLFSFTYPWVDAVGLFKAPVRELTGEVVYIIPDWEQVPAETFNGWPFLFGLVVLGALWFSVRLFVRLLSLRRIHGQSHAAMWQRFRYRRVFAPIRPFSFWRNIYVNVDHHAEGELREVFRHEQVHVSGLHTVDVLLAEVCSILCWFNPGIWLLRHAIRENLEFITDRNVLRSGVDKKAYQYSLLGVGRQLADYPGVAQGFNFKNLKRRMMMMNKRNSSRLQLGRYLLAVPVIVVFVLLFTMSRAAYGPDAPNAGAVLGNPANMVTIEVAPEQPQHHDEPQPDEGSSGKATPPTVDAPTAQRVADPDTIKPKRDSSAAVKLVRTLSGDNRDPLFILDGEAQEEGFDVRTLDADALDRIEVFKDAKATALYGKRGVNGVIVITSKAQAQKEAARRDTGEVREITVIGYPKDASEDKPAAGGDFNGALIVIDGEASTAASLRQLSPDDIESMDVLKGTAATDKYGDKGKKGVIEVSTTYSRSL